MKQRGRQRQMSRGNVYNAPSVLTATLMTVYKSSSFKLTMVPRHVRMAAGLGTRVSELQAGWHTHAGSRRGVGAEGV